MARSSSIRNSTGQFTVVPGLPGHGIVLGKGDAKMGTQVLGQGNAKHVVASETVIVHDDQLNIDRQVVAGQEVPPDLVDAYLAEVGETGSSKAHEADEPKEEAAVDAEPAARRGGRRRPADGE